MTINFDETTIISIYREKTRKQTIDSIREMMTHLEDDETELKTLSENTVKNLKSMTDEEFEAIEFIPNFTD